MLLFLIQILYLGDGALIGYQLLVPDLESQVQKEFVKLPNGGLDQDELKNLQNINRHYYSPFAVRGIIQKSKLQRYGTITQNITGK